MLIVLSRANRMNDDVAKKFHKISYVFVLVQYLCRLVTWVGTRDKPKSSFVELQTQSLVKHLARVLLATTPPTGNLSRC